MRHLRWESIDQAVRQGILKQLSMAQKTEQSWEHRISSVGYGKVQQSMELVTDLE
jgi:hypothetical protein